MITSVKHPELEVKIGKRVRALANCYAYVDGKQIQIAQPGTAGRFMGWVSSSKKDYRYIIQWARTGMNVPCDKNKVEWMD